jgi:heme exporter protein D
MPDLDTGKYALFVWPAFAVTALGFAWMIADSLARARRWKAEVERLSVRFVSDKVAK